LKNHWNARAGEHQSRPERGTFFCKSTVCVPGVDILGKPAFAVF
jgi:hypothetical protein